MISLSLTKIIIIILTSASSIVLAIITYIIKRILKDIDNNTESIKIIANQLGLIDKDVVNIQNELKNKIDADNLNLILKNIDLKFENILNTIKNNSK